MNRRPNPSAVSSRAFTLMEVLLVLCLIVALTAVAWPTLERPMAVERLKKAADQVRGEWIRARIEAMSSGYTVRFHYAPERGEYSIDAQAGPESTEALGDSEEIDMFSQEYGLCSPRNDALPESIRFVGAETASDTRSAAAVDGASQPLDDAMAGSEPILFYPDGTTSTAHLRLANEHGRAIELSLRGLTGVATVGDVVSLGGLGL